MKEIFSILSNRNELAPLFPLMLNLLSLVPWMREHKLRTENNIAIGQTILLTVQISDWHRTKIIPMTKCQLTKTSAQISCWFSMSVANNISEIVSDWPRDQSAQRGGEDCEGHPAPHQHQGLRLPPRGQLWYLLGAVSELFPGETHLPLSLLRHEPLDRHLRLWQVWKLSLE